MKIGGDVWHSVRVAKPNATVSTFNQPTKIKTRLNYFTVMPASARGYLAIMEFGEKVNKTWFVVANMIFQGKINVGDVMWVDGHKPNTDIEEKYGYGASANAEVIAVNIGNHCLNITLGENTKQIKR